MIIDTHPSETAATIGTSRWPGRLAVGRALPTWSSVVAESGMPKREIVLFAVDQVDPHDTPIG